MNDHKKNHLIRLVFFGVIIHIFTFADAQYNVKAYGAKGDGLSMDTRFIQQAIDEANKNKGGTVEIPAGVYKIGTVILRDYVELHLQNGAVLLGSENYKDYLEVTQKLPSRTKNLYAKHFMIFAEGAKNISITGSGVIYGNGLEHYKEVRPQNLRPYMIRLVDCNNVLIRDVKLIEAANWTLHLLGCSEVNIDNITIETRGEGNRDGLDIDGCNEVKVTNSSFFTTDDAIVLKATNDRVCENISISNCLVRGSGGSGIKTGTESNGGFRNITVSNCVINNIPVHAGVEFMTVDGGFMQNILVNNIAMNNVATPFFIRLGKRARPYQSGQYVKSIGDVKDIKISNVIADSASFPSSIIGLHSNKIQNIDISDFTVRYKKSQPGVSYNKVPFQEFDYPAAIMFEKLPAYALYCRSVDGLSLRNINTTSFSDDKRAAFVFDRVFNLTLFHLKDNSVVSTSPMAYLRNAQDVVAAFCSTNRLLGVLLGVEGNNEANLKISSNILTKGQVEVKREVILKDDLLFDDFNTSMKYTVTNNMLIRGLPAQSLVKPAEFKMEIKEGNSHQLCLLVLNSSFRPQKLFVSYAGIIQEFLINWNEWGWAPVSLIKNLPQGENITFTVFAEPTGDPLYISKAYLLQRDIGFTD